MSSWFTQYLPGGSHGPNGTRLNDGSSSALSQAPCDSYLPLPTLQDTPSASTPNGIASLSSRHSLRHGRSLSHPFPSLFGKKRPTRKGGNEIFSRHASNQIHEDDLHMPGVLLSPGRALDSGNEDGFKSGNCPTCGSSLRWPQHLQVYRCSACLMVNDLLPIRERQHLPISRHKDESARINLGKQKVIGKRTSNPTELGGSRFTNNLLQRHRYLSKEPKRSRQCVS